MKSRTLLSRLVVVPVVILLAAACGGRVDSVALFPDADAGDPACEAGAPVCPPCPGVSKGPEPMCNDRGDWQCPDAFCPEVDAGGCPANVFDLVGKPCTDESLSCTSGGCDDPCEFCNVVFCKDGSWQQAEAPPEPCVDGG